MGQNSVTLKYKLLSFIDQRKGSERNLSFTQARGYGNIKRAITEVPGISEKTSSTNTKIN